jgi:hypothetical protein
VTSPEYLQGSRDEQDERRRGRGKSKDKDRERDGTSSPERNHTPSRTKSGGRSKIFEGGNSPNGGGQSAIQRAGGDGSRTEMLKSSDGSLRREHIVSRMDSEMELEARWDSGFSRV